jgi:hypothetical protein
MPIADRKRNPETHLGWEWGGCSFQPHLNNLEDSCLIVQGKLQGFMRRFSIGRLHVLARTEPDFIFWLVTGRYSDLPISDFTAESLPICMQRRNLSSFIFKPHM